MMKDILRNVWLVGASVVDVAVHGLRAIDEMMKETSTDCKPVRVGVTLIEGPKSIL